MKKCNKKNWKRKEIAFLESFLKRNTAIINIHPLVLPVQIASKKYSSQVKMEMLVKKVVEERERTKIKSLKKIRKRRKRVEKKRDIVGHREIANCLKM